jgi:hypothetical protein
VTSGFSLSVPALAVIGPSLSMFHLDRHDSAAIRRQSALPICQRSPSPAERTVATPDFSDA